MIQHNINIMASFSSRYGYHERAYVAPSDLVREDAPEPVRVGFLAIFEERLGPSGLRDVACKVLRKRPDVGNWSEYPNIWDEVQELVHRAPWQRFYDIVEAAIGEIPSYNRVAVTEELNDLFAEEHLAWHIVDGQVTLRTGDVTDEVIAHALRGLEEAGRPTAAGELQKAITALSRRPEPDTRDAVRCAAGAMEALARDITGDRTATLGEILRKKGSVLLAEPLPKAFSMIWGYASDVARHVDERKEPTLEEALFVVGVVGSSIALLSRR